MQFQFIPSLWRRPPSRHPHPWTQIKSFQTVSDVKLSVKTYKHTFFLLLVQPPLKRQDSIKPLLPVVLSYVCGGFFVQQKVKWSVILSNQAWTAAPGNRLSLSKWLSYFLLLNLFILCHVWCVCVSNEICCHSPVIHSSAHVSISTEWRMSCSTCCFWV